MARLKSCYSCAKFKMFEPCEMRMYQTDGACWVAPNAKEENDSSHNTGKPFAIAHAEEPHVGCA